MSPEQAGKVLGLPATQAANILKNGVDFYAITPKTGTTPPYLYRMWPVRRKVRSRCRERHSKVDGNFQSVTEQSGMLAGDDGFAVNVGGNTDLKGSKIASTDQAVNAGKNSLTTGSLTLSDIENKSQYQADGLSLSVGAGNNGGKTQAQQQRLADAACAMTHCPVGLPDNDPYKAALAAAELRATAY